MKCAELVNRKNRVNDSLIPFYKDFCFRVL